MISSKTPGGITRVKDAASCREWLASLQLSPAERLQVLERLWANMERSSSPPDLMLEILDQARPTHLADVDDRLREVSASAFPMPSSAWAILQQALVSMRRARDLYKRTYTQLVDDSGVSTHMVIPGSATSLRSVLPLSRALDYQARVLRAQLLARVRVGEDDWRELMVLARHLRASTYLDAPLPDPAAFIKVVNSRALFVYPMLLHAASLTRHIDPEVAIIDRMARQWAAKVGFRIDDDGRLHENSHGPTMLLTATGSVRLDTQALIRRLEERIRVLDSSAGAPADIRLPRGMSRDKVRRLLDGMRLRWSSAWRPEPPAPPLTDKLLLRFGPPASNSDARPTRGHDDLGAPIGLASMSYVYGRHEQNSVIRIAMGVQGGPSDPIEQLMVGADPVAWSGKLADVIEFERRAAAPLTLGTLVAFHVGEGARRELRLGRVCALSQAAEGHGDNTRIQRITALMWPMTGDLVGIRLADSAFYEDAFHLPAGPRSNDPHSVIVPPGRWRIGAPAMLRTRDRDVRVLFDHLLERDSGFDRVAIRTFEP
ncbi:MAG TPA: addiction module protein [Burkholderiaceae bacterium]|nr:addiction module protein [Burkholderiaceae bacterium]